MDSNKIIENYMANADWKINENANAGYSISGLQLQLSDNAIKSYMLNSVYTKDIKKAYNDGFFHIHDLGMGNTVYCFGHDLREILQEGYNGVTGKVSASPPKHLRSALNQLVNYLFTTQGECYSKDTKVLTLDGYKYFADVAYSDKIATLNPDTHELEYQNPTNIIKKPAKKLIEFKNTKNHIKVTPEHDFYGATNPKPKQYKKIKAKDIKTIYIPNRCNWTGTKNQDMIIPSITLKKYSGFKKAHYFQELPDIKINMMSWVKFLAIYLTEGCIYQGTKIDRRRNQIKKENYVRISQQKFTREFEEVLNELPFSYTCKKSNGKANEYVIYNKQLTEYLAQFGKSYDKFIPIDIKNLPIEYLKEMYKYLKLGDGLTDTSNGNECYYSASLKMAEDVQEIMMKIGQSANIYKRSNDRFSWYVVSMSKQKHSTFSPKDKTEIEYNDDVYCVTVPNGIIHVNLNGRTIWNGNCAGAQAVSNFDTLLAPFIKEEDLSYKEVKQSIQEFIYSMNVANRVGFQAPFTNITFDLKCSETFIAQHPIINNKQLSFTYGDCNKEIGMIAKAFFEIMMNGDAEGKPFTFPIPTINLHKDFIWDDDVAQTIFEATAKYGIPSFQNFLNSDLDPNSVFSMCCRLSIKKDELQQTTGGIFGSGVKTGSLGVVTINLPRIAYIANNTSKNKNEQIQIFFTLLEKYMDIAHSSLEIKREHINKNMERNLMPYLKRYCGTFKNHFSTIATIGANEMCLNLLNTDLSTDMGQIFVNDVLLFMRKKIKEYQEKTGNLYNLEQAPAEGASYKLALRDIQEFPDIKTAGIIDNPYYTNSTHLPVGHKLSVQKMLKSQEQLNIHYNGGTICHVYLGQRVTDWINCMLLVKKIATTTTLPFFDLVPSFSICPIHGYIAGEHESCPLEHSAADLKKYGELIHSKNE